MHLQHIEKMVTIQIDEMGVRPALVDQRIREKIIWLVDYVDVAEKNRRACKQLFNFQVKGVTSKVLFFILTLKLLTLNAIKDLETAEFIIAVLDIVTVLR